jgi:hypothetical protein
VADWAGGSWGRNGKLVYTRAYNTGLWIVSEGGSDERMLTKPDTTKAELGHWWPQVLPDGDHVIFTAYRTPIEIVDRPASPTRLRASRPACVSPGMSIGPPDRLRRMRERLESVDFAQQRDHSLNSSFAVRRRHQHRVEQCALCWIAPADWARGGRRSTTRSYAVYPGGDGAGGRLRWDPVTPAAHCERVRPT